MDDFDLGKILNYFYAFFVVVLIVMIVFFSRLVSIMITQKKGVSLTKANASQTSGKTYLEDAYTMTVRLTQLAELQSSRGGEITPEQKEIIVTLAEGRRQAILAVIEESPQAVQATVFLEELRMALPEEARTFIEKKGVVEGKIQSIYSNGGEEKKGATHTTITTSDGNKYVLYFGQGDMTYPSTGSRVIIQGVILDNRIIVDSVKQI